MTAAEYSPDSRRWRALAVTQLAGFMGLLDISIVTVALPSIEQDLGASAATVQWVVSGYALTFGLVLVAAGRLGDAIGRRRMFLIALTGFVLSSAAVGAAPNAELLVAARLVQGLCAGLLTPQNSGLIQDLFRGAERGKAFGIFGATVGFSTAVGPVLGGIILHVADSPSGWRWVFFVNVPIGLLAILAASRWVPESGRDVTRPDIDVLGALLLGGAVLGVLVPLIRSEDGGLRELWWLFLPAVALAVAFVRWERRVLARNRAPLLDTNLLARLDGYRSGALIGMLYFVGFSGIWLVMALYFQTGLGYSALESGLAVTPFALGSVVSSALAGRVITRIGRIITLVGLALTGLGLGATALVMYSEPGSHVALWVAGPLLVAGLGGGAVISPNITLTLQEVPVRMAGAAGGALQTGQRIGAAVGSAVLASIFYGLVEDDGPGTAVATALATSVGFMVLAFAVAALEVRAGPPGRHRADRLEFVAVPQV